MLPQHLPSLRRYQPLVVRIELEYLLDDSCSIYELINRFTTNLATNHPISILWFRVRFDLENVYGASITVIDDTKQVGA
jgi:hypothetical protein